MSRARMLSRRQAAEWQAAKCLGCDRLIQPKQTPRGDWYITVFCSRRCARHARMRPIPQQACELCSAPFTPISGQSTNATGRNRGGTRARHYCSKQCADRARHKLEGFIRTRNGYVVFHTGKAEVPVHRIVMESRLGRPLTATETVHHINGQRDDNRPENLELWDHAQPHGQRVADKLRWCVEYLAAHRYVALTELGPARIMSG